METLLTTGEIFFFFGYISIMLAMLVDFWERSEHTITSQKNYSQHERLKKMIFHALRYKSSITILMIMLLRIVVGLIIAEFFSGVVGAALIIGTILYGTNLIAMRTFLKNRPLIRSLIRGRNTFEA